MAIVDDYAGIAAELRRIRAEREPQKQSPKRAQTIPYVTGRGTIEVGIRPGPPLRHLPVFGRRGGSTD